MQECYYYGIKFFEYLQQIYLYYWRKNLCKDKYKNWPSNWLLDIELLKL